MTVGVMSGNAGVPTISQPERSGQDIVILPEIIGGLRPERAVTHRVSLGYVAARMSDEKTVIPGGNSLVKAVEPSEADFPHILVSLDAGGLGVTPGTVVITAIHEAVIVISGGHSVPRLPGLLIIAYIPVSQDETTTEPGQTAVPRPGLSGRPVDETIRSGSVERPVNSQMVPKKP